MKEGRNKGAEKEKNKVSYNVNEQWKRTKNIKDKGYKQKKLTGSNKQRKLGTMETNIGIRK